MREKDREGVKDRKRGRGGRDTEKGDIQVDKLKGREGAERERERGAESLQFNVLNAQGKVK